MASDRRSLDEVLQGIAHILFPGDDEPRRIALNSADCDGDTPLYVAVRAAQPRTIAALLAAGAREDVVSEFGQTPLQLAQLENREGAYRKATLLARDIEWAKRPPHGKAK